MAQQQYTTKRRKGQHLKLERILKLKIGNIFNNYESIY